MIYTLTPNPALDLGGIVDNLVPNEKNYVYSETRDPGGNGINAARVIHALGVPVRATGFLGGGSGDEIKDLLIADGVDCAFVGIRAHTRVSVTVSNRKSGLQTRLSFPGPKIRKQDREKLLGLASRIPKSSLFVIGGSLPEGFGEQMLMKLIKVAKKRNVFCVVDVPGRHLRAAVDAGPLLIKPNLVEFQELVGRSVTGRHAVLEAARKVTAKVALVCVSSVDGGALLVGRDSAWFGKGPPVTVRSQVGAGDSMVGAMSAMLWRLKRFEENLAEIGGDLLRWGLAAATATLTTPGTKLGTGKEIKRYYSRVHIERVA